MSALPSLSALPVNAELVRRLQSLRIDTLGTKRPATGTAAARLNSANHSVAQIVLSRLMLTGTDDSVSAASDSRYGAALLVDEMREVHPILMAWTLGQSAILHEHARSSKALLAKQGDEVGVLMAEAREAAKELSPKISQLVDDISSLTLLEASELSEARERAFSPALFFVWRRRPFRVGGLLLGMAISPLGVCVCRLRILRVSRLRTLRASLSRVLEPPLDFGTSN